MIDMKRTFESAVWAEPAQWQLPDLIAKHWTLASALFSHIQPAHRAVIGTYIHIRTAYISCPSSYERCRQAQSGCTQQQRCTHICRCKYRFNTNWVVALSPCFFLNHFPRWRHRTWASYPQRYRATYGKSYTDGGCKWRRMESARVKLNEEWSLADPAVSH